MFERLSTPRSAPKVTLKCNWRTQQQQQLQPQQPILDKGFTCIWKQRANRESRAGVRDDTKHATEEEQAARKLVRATSEVDVGTHLSETEAITDTFSNKKTNIQDIERVKNCFEQNFLFEKTYRRRRWCSAKNPAKPFSTWVTSNSSNWRSQRSSAHDAFTTYLKGHFFANLASY